nr:hypothetical protein CFP56_01319 [Quercus suber]
MSRTELVVRCIEKSIIGTATAIDTTTSTKTPWACARKPLQDDQVEKAVSKRNLGWHRKSWDIAKRSVHRPQTKYFSKLKARYRPSLRLRAGRLEQCNSRLTSSAETKFVFA